MPEKILITGASGFIGSFLAEEALRQGFEVWAGIRTSSHTRFLQQPGIQLLLLDLSSREALEEVLAKHVHDHGPFNYVVHNAGITYAKRKADFFTVNFEYTKNLVASLQSSTMKLKKFVLISSLAAYGPGPDNSGDPVTVTDKPHPVSSYGKSKLLAENYLQSLPGFPYLIANPTAVYGPRDKDFLQFFKLVKLGLEPVIGSGDQYISLVYVKDLARAVIQLLNHPANRRSFIISDGEDYLKQQLGEVVKRILHKKTVRINVPLSLLRPMTAILEMVYGYFGTMPFLNNEKLNEISHPNWRCDSREVWQVLSSSPGYSLENGISETLEWYQNNNWL
jgi:nucleoside-diphosphate-sugar epimerase